MAVSFETLRDARKECEVIDFYLVDAFASRLFEGNPAGVVPDAEGVPDTVRLAIASEINASETAFLERQSDGWALRWFSPVHEVDFCGHATLAAAHVLASELGETPPFCFRTRVGTIIVAHVNGQYMLQLPRFDPQIRSDPVPILVELFGDRAVEYFNNFENHFIRLSDEEAVSQYSPDLAKLATLFPMGVCITAHGSADTDFVSRYFAPGAGIPEDPVTGSTHATLAPYWSAKLATPSLRARQISRRGGVLGCKVEAEHVLVSGTAVTVFGTQLR